MWQGLFEKAGFELLNNYVYDIDVEVPAGKVNEKSYIFVLKRSQTPVKEIFKTKYGIEVQG
jgi:hypothetical protein